ncbi:sulfur-oxidizing protein SoxZ [Bathymodiolus platifrons methanotrophic gill symbiont]|uniref:thiosulfate oxidation carrier complex protein SoxZ n=1 Tax=Bathymodiolus platifrons methanotrophic gill symbiont TaxID=113268 RepID=UPI000B41A5D2|nr:thiosulfate oxidation carrier complex protein SoxZ [Bathymodiolus platifrons methanotrophic gill symbiont]TXK99499.1 thiosulfate oxidation carrier complex protein SoxZ [Methylococcaceae bacterium CS4]TXL00837.1 thiosulfate oxidation carrier complex protein SoxZ [Methylococcaceae bacterium CS5]TXL01442.1 thiosulfate oxidation carrier complex protein SoxZ [Methylococcaceae bacterium HT1]TXL08797.1 thiosulfate oxidation carrier complex protein SoxZ [Methylococcaceae bacterium CS1]TXL09046.1 th
MSSIKIRSKRLADFTLVRTLIAHPMETGKRKDEETGELVAAHFIQTLSFKHNDQLMSQCQMGFGVSKNPFFSFHIKSAQPGDKVTISWEDNLGYQDTAEHIIR